MKNFVRMLSVGACMLALQAQATPTAETFSGDAYALAGDALLYRETHFQLSGDEQVVLYRCPDGRPFARKHSLGDGNAQTPDFDLVDARLGYREGVRRNGAQREVYVQRTAAQPEQADPLRVPADGVIDTGFDVFAKNHWDELVRGDAVRFNYLVPSRRTFYAFKVGKVDTPNARAGAVTFRLSSGSWFSFLLPHIDVTYDVASRHVLRYEGLSNIRGPNGKNLQVRYEYPKVGIHEAAPGEVAAALDAPLASSCTLADNSASARGHAPLP